MSKGRIDRRDFIKGAVLTGAGLALGGGLLYVRRSLAALLAGDQGAIDQAIHDHKLGQISDADAQATVADYMTSGPAQPRVVHVHSDGATSWNGETDYWNYVDQSVVDSMVDQGVMALTGASTVADAWRALLPDYQTGQGIAIKVNLNNSWTCDDTDGIIDALIQPVNAVVRGLKQVGVAETDIWVYDAIRWIPDRFVDQSQYDDVQFFDSGCRNPAGWASSDPDAYVTFSPPVDIPAPPNRRIADVLINATYLINMPIMKIHSSTSTGVSLAFKNHFGTIMGPGALHDYVCFNGSYFRTDYSPFVDLYRNPHIAGKTVLTIGDGLFAAMHFSAGPSPWATFDNQAPKSLFFATDPVAIDCVMCDFLAAETNIPLETDSYLRLASDAGLGVFERGDPWGGGYSQIDYSKIEL
jgi:hypothetical protein